MLIVVITCASVVGRNWLGWTLVGDFELTGALVGVAIANFLPWCQVTRGNIIVDFFSSRCASATNARLDRLGAMALSITMALLAWRTTVGGLNAWSNQSSSMLLGLPDWMIYGAMVPALALVALIGAVQASSADHDASPTAAHTALGESSLP